MLRRRHKAAFPAIREIGSFHVGGGIHRIEGLPLTKLTPLPGSPTLEIDPNGMFVAGQMYVQYTRLRAPASGHPLMLWHGGGLTGACWETTPDGRPGWQSAFLRMGFDVYVSDAVERGRAGWARSPEIFPGAPFFMPQHAAWELYRIGPAAGFAAEPRRRSAFAGSRFPVESYDRFCRQIVPRFHGNEPMILSAYDACLEQVGPAIVVAHSQGGGFAMTAALRRPDKVVALVLVEPGGVPTLGRRELERLSGIPMLLLWGDHVNEVDFWRSARRATLELARARSGAQAPTTVVDLPADGVTGNSHLLMMDRNSDEIAWRIGAWLSEMRLSSASASQTKPQSLRHHAHEPIAKEQDGDHEDGALRDEHP